VELKGVNVTGPPCAVVYQPTCSLIPNPNLPSFLHHAALSTEVNLICITLFAETFYHHCIVSLAFELILSVSHLTFLVIITKRISHNVFSSLLRYLLRRRLGARPTSRRSPLGDRDRAGHRLLVLAAKANGAWWLGQP
jgi:hypothetical protein